MEEDLTKREISPNDWSKYARSYHEINPQYQISLLEHTGTRIFGDILDFGAGVGKLIKVHSKSTKSTSYFGLEQNPFMREYAKDEANKSIKPAIISGNTLDEILKENNKFDSIICLNVLYANKNQVEILEKLRELLSNQTSRIIIADPSDYINVDKLKTALLEEYKEHPLFNEYIEINTKLMENAIRHNIQDIEKLLYSSGFKVSSIRKDFYYNSLNFVEAIKK